MDDSDAAIVSLGDRMKKYEASTLMKLDPKQPWIIRIDGHKFSSYTRPFKHPFDDRISNAMTLTCMDLLTAFHPSTVFTCSDEITMIFPVPAEDEASPDAGGDEAEAPLDVEVKVKKPYTLPYNGKVQKIASLTAAFASVCFDRHMQAQDFSDPADAKLLAHVKTQKPHFDSRIFNVPSTNELINNLIWRSHYDFRRNSISTYARAFFSAKELHKLNSHQQLAKLVSEKNVSWEDLDPKYKYGCFIKKEKYVKAVEVNGKTVEAQRSRPVVRSFEFNKCNAENEAFLVSKYVASDSNTGIN